MLTVRVIYPRFDDNGTDSVNYNDRVIIHAGHLLHKRVLDEI